MNGSRLITDILYENYFLSNERTLFKIQENDAIERIENDAMKEKIYTILHDFKAFNKYCCANNRLIPDTLYYNHTGNTMIYQFENQTYNIIKEQEFGYSIISDLSFSGSGQYFFDFRVKDDVKFQKDDPTLVLELFDQETGERIFWHGLDLGEKQGFLHFPFDVQQEKEVILKAYFWNNKQTELYLPNTSCRFYRVK
jgi:hypothetical protein